MLTIDLPPELETALNEHAKKQGTTPELIALDALQRLYLRPADHVANGQTLAEAWKDYIGSVDSSTVIPQVSRAHYRVSYSNPSIITEDEQEQRKGVLKELITEQERLGLYE